MFRIMKDATNQNWLIPVVGALVVIMVIFLSMPVTGWDKARNDVIKEQIHMNQTLTVLTGDNNRYQETLINLIKGFMDKTGFKYKIEFMSWPRAYRTALTLENSLIYELDKTEERSKLFNWILPLRVRPYLLAAKNTEEMKNFQKEDIALGKYKAICIDRTFACDVFLSYGFAEKDIIRVPYLKQYNLESLVYRNRADIVLVDKETILSPTNKLTPLLDEFKSTSYLAASKDLDPEILIKLQETVQSYRD